MGIQPQRTQRAQSGDARRVLIQEETGEGVPPRRPCDRMVRALDRKSAFAKASAGQER